MAKPPRVIITGASGFIGSYLTDYFARSGYSVIALVRNIPPASPSSAIHKTFSLNREIDETAFHDADFLVHCAYVSYPRVRNAREVNINGTRKLIDLSRKHNLKKLIFLSSMSAHEEARSVYGISKGETELLFDLERDVVLKPGLVIGDGGLFRNILQMLQHSRVVPLIAGGNQMIQTIAIEDLAYCIKESVEHDIAGLFPIASPETVTLRELYHEASLLLQKRIHFVALPYVIAEILLTISDVLRLPLGVSRENLRGLRFTKTFDVHDYLNTFKVQPMNYKESMRRVFR